MFVTESRAQVLGCDGEHGGSVEIASGSGAGGAGGDVSISAGKSGSLGGGVFGQPFCNKFSHDYKKNPLNMKLEGIKPKILKQIDPMHNYVAMGGNDGQNMPILMTSSKYKHRSTN